MEVLGDYHLHTSASDGRVDIAGHIRAAKARGLAEIAICDHSFSTFMFHMTQKKFERQRKEISSLEGHGIKVLQGVEANIIGASIDVPHTVIRRCDVLTAGFQRYISPSKRMGESRFLRVNGFGSVAAKEKLVCYNTEAFMSVLENYPVDILAHLGHRAPVDVAKVCECAARHNVYIELNEKHIDALEQDIGFALESGVKFVLGSDAHSAKNTGGFGKVQRFIEKHGVPEERIYGAYGKLPKFKDKRGWKYGNDV